MGRRTYDGWSVYNSLISELCKIAYTFLSASDDSPLSSELVVKQRRNLFADDPRSEIYAGVKK